MPYAPHQLTFEQARLAMVLGYAINRPSRHGGGMIVLRQSSVPAPEGYAQAPYTFTQQDRLATDWEIAK